MSADFFLGWIPQEVWAGLNTFWLALSLWPWFVGFGIVCLLIGAWLGPAKTSVLVTAGVALIWLANRKAAPEPMEYRDSMKPSDAAPRPKRRTAKRDWKPPKSLTEE